MNSERKIVYKSKRWNSIKIILILVLSILLLFFIDWIMDEVLYLEPFIEMWMQIFADAFIIGAAIYFVTTLVAKRKYEYYIIEENEIIFKTGIFVPKQRSYLYSSFESIEFTQNAVQKFCGYGDIRINVISMDDNLVLREIPNPEEITSLIMNSIKKKKTEKIKADNLQ